MKQIFSILTFALVTMLSVQAQNYKFTPPKYVCYKATQPIKIDGEIYSGEWENAPWSEEFRDIRGDEYPVKPKYPTRMKMMWDDQNLYIAAELIEPHIWGTLRQRDTVIYHDNDFEVFIDPDGDTHNYFEFEINALGTEWDLMMTKPYRVGGTFINGFDMAGLKTKVKHYGTINNPNDTDDKWVVEMAIPFKALVNHTVKNGDHWRLNFSRVEWQSVEIKDNTYAKTEGKTGFGHEDNWVWAPTGVVDIHMPEYWGFVSFSDKTSGDSTDFKWNNNEDVKFVLRELLNRQKEFYAAKGHFAKDMGELGGDKINLKGLKFNPIFYPAGSLLKITVEGYQDTRWVITSDSRVWQSK